MAERVTSEVWGCLLGSGSPPPCCVLSLPVGGLRSPKPEAELPAEEWMVGAYREHQKTSFV